MNMEKVLKNGIKIAAVALTSPATLEVAGSLYPDRPIYRFVVQIAALVLVEGALMLGWWQLDNDRKAEIPQRVLYATLAGVSYIGLWSIAIAHGEGAAGITFRLTLGVALGYSVFESGILANIRGNRSVERDATKDRAVRRHDRRLSIQEAKAERSSIYRLNIAQMKADEENRLAIMEETIRLEGQRTLEDVRISDREQRRTLSVRKAKTSAAASSNDLEKVRQAKVRKDTADREQATRMILEEFTDNPKLVQARLIERLPVGRSLYYDLKNGLIADGLLEEGPDGGLYVREPSAASTNGNGHHT